MDNTAAAKALQELQKTGKEYLTHHSIAESELLSIADFPALNLDL